MREILNRKKIKEERINHKSRRRGVDMGPFLDVKTIGGNLMTLSMAVMFIGLPLEAAALFSGDNTATADPLLAKIFLGTLVGGTLGVFLGAALEDNG